MQPDWPYLQLPMSRYDYRTQSEPYWLHSYRYRLIRVSSTTKYRIYIFLSLCYDFSFMARLHKTSNKTIEMIIIQPKQINKGWTTHTPIDKMKISCKIITGRIYVIKSDNDYPYELNWQLTQKYINIFQYVSIYINITDTVK